MSKQQLSLEETTRRWNVRDAFENNNAKLQYRLLSEDTWRNAHWCDWEWHKYDYRIAPEQLEDILFPLVCFLNSFGEVVWVSQDKATHAANKGWRPIKRFVTLNKVRHAVV
jgi:hypothetical protein